MSLVPATLLIARAHLLGIVWSKKSLLCVASALVVAGIASIGTAKGSIAPAELFTHLGYLLLLQVTLPIVTLVLGSAIVAEEIEDRTISYLFSRPIPRSAVLLGRWLATVLYIAVLLSIAVALLALVSRAARGEGETVEPRLVRQLLVSTLAGGAVYAAIFGVMGVFLRRPMILGLAYVFAVEGFLANLPGENQALSIQYYLRSLIAAQGPKLWNRVEGFATTQFATAGEASYVLVSVLLVTLLVGAIGISVRQYELSA